MSTFTEEMQRRLRAVLSLRVHAPLRSDIPIEIAMVSTGDVEGDPLPGKLQLRTTAHPHTSWDYTEPGAWGKLLADLEAADDPAPIKAADAPATPPLAFVHVWQIGEPRDSSSWWAWDELGAKYFLWFRHGEGKVALAEGAQVTDTIVRRFVQGTSSHITLDAFAHYAGIDVSQIPEEERR